MSGQAVQAGKLKRSAPDPANGHHNEEAEVERSYTENCSANAQEAVDALMTNMDFLEREGDLLYRIPKGAGSASNKDASMR